MQALLHLSQPVTDDYLSRLSCDNAGWQFERDGNGTLVVTPPTTFDGGAKNAVLTYHLFAYAKSFGGKAFGSSAGSTMPDTAVYSPDGAWIASERWNALARAARDSFAPLVPDVWVESRSKTDAPEKLRQKLLMIRRFGAVYVALVDPYERTLWKDGTPPPDFAIDLATICDA